MINIIEEIKKLEESLLEHQGCVKACINNLERARQQEYNVKANIFRLKLKQFSDEGGWNKNDLFMTEMNASMRSTLLLNIPRDISPTFFKDIIPDFFIARFRVVDIIVKNDKHYTIDSCKDGGSYGFTISELYDENNPDHEYGIPVGAMEILVEWCNNYGIPVRNKGINNE